MTRWLTLFDAAAPLFDVAARLFGHGWVSDVCFFSCRVNVASCHEVDQVGPVFSFLLLAFLLPLIATLQLSRACSV